MDSEDLKWFYNWKKALKKHNLFLKIYKEGHKDFQTRKKLRIQKNEGNSH
jgi:hypothetical protein